MPYGLLYNLNIVSSISFQRVAGLKQFQPLIKPVFSQKSSIRVSSGLSRQVLRYSNDGSCKTAATGSVVPSGDMVVDSLVPSFGNVAGFVKPGGVFFSGKSSRICKRAGVSMRTGEANSCHWFHESKRLLITSGSLFRKAQRNSWMQSYSCYSDRAGPEVSVDASLSMEQLSSLALSAEQYDIG